MLEHMAMQLQLRHPRHKVNEHRQYSNELESKLQSCMQSILSKIRYLKTGKFIAEPRTTIKPYVGSTNQQFEEVRHAK